MWKVYIDKEVNDPKYGKRTMTIELGEGNRKDCDELAARVPGAYVTWYCY